MRDDTPHTTPEQEEANATAERRHTAFTRAEVKHERRRHRAKARRLRRWEKSAEMVRRQGATRTPPPSVPTPPSVGEIFERLAEFYTRGGPG